MPDTTSPTDAQDSVALTPVERVVNTFIEPSKTFQDIKRNRSWWLPFVILVVLGWIFCFAAVQHVGWENLTTNVLKSQPTNAERLDKATPAQAAQMLSITKGFMEGFMIGTPAVILIINAIFALLLWGGFAFLLGGTTTFAEMFTVAIFAALPNALNSIISLVTVMVAEPQSYTSTCRRPPISPTSLARMPRTGSSCSAPRSMSSRSGRWCSPASAPPSSPASSPPAAFCWSSPSGSPTCSSKPASQPHRLTQIGAANKTGTDRIRPCAFRLLKA